jgi:hypothetical protein
MPVKEADPRARKLDTAFAEAMAGPAKPREAKTPPEIDREAPHGRGEDGTPKAPYGHNKDGSVKRSPAGRKPKDDAARVTGDAPAAAPKGTLAPHDFSAGLMDAGETLWFGAAVAARLGPQIPLVGKFIPGRKIAATAAVFDAERPRLAAALNLAAQHDARARKVAARLADGEGSWALSVMFMVAPFTAAAAAVWQGDKALAERELPPLAELATRNEEALDRMFTKISAQMEKAQQTQAQMMAEAEMMQAQAQALANGQVTV